MFDLKTMDKMHNKRILDKKLKEKTNMRKYKKIKELICVRCGHELVGFYVKNGYEIFDYDICGGYFGYEYAIKALEKEI